MKLLEFLVPPYLMLCDEALRVVVPWDGDNERMADAAFFGLGFDLLVHTFRSQRGLTLENSSVKVGGLIVAWRVAGGLRRVAVEEAKLCDFQ